jgi:sec-independent protein translocase protein TatB
MFDISFSELFVIGLVALIVIGPQRLPKVARTAGHLFGRMQRYVNDVKADINREMELEELRKLRSEFEDAARTVEKSVRQVGSEVRAAENEIQQSVESLKDSTQAQLDDHGAVPTTPAPTDSAPKV